MAASMNVCKIGILNIRNKLLYSSRPTISSVNLKFSSCVRCVYKKTSLLKTTPKTCREFQVRNVFTWYNRQKKRFIQKHRAHEKVPGTVLAYSGHNELSLRVAQGFLLFISILPITAIYKVYEATYKGKNTIKESTKVLRSNTELIIASVGMLTLLAVLRIISNRYIVRMYYHVDNKIFSAIQIGLNPLVSKQTLKIPAGQMKVVYYNEELTGSEFKSAIEIFRGLHSYNGKRYIFSPNHFKNPLYYNILIGTVNPDDYDIECDEDNEMFTRDK